MTYSIVARDPGTGEFGVAVQTHYFAVGRTVPWARPGVGVVATQASVGVSYGPEGLALMAQGLSAPATLAQLLAEDPGREVRQVALIDTQGRVGAHTGADCVIHAGHVTGEAVSCQGNIMSSPEVWGAMLAGYELARATGASMPRRLLAAMDGAEAHGGDVRGRQSVAMLVVPGAGSLGDKELDLRVEEHPEPLVEMARLVGLHEALASATQGHQELAAGNVTRAAERYEAALAQWPDSHELKLRIGTALAHAGELERGLPLVREAIAVQPRWAWLLPRVSDAQLLGATTVSAELGLSAG